MVKTSLNGNPITSCFSVGRLFAEGQFGSISFYGVTFHLRRQFGNDDAAANVGDV